MLLKPVLPVLDYILNYDYISNELCVNRETKIIGCDGKCYLVKELAKASDAEKPISSNKKLPITDLSDLFCSLIADSYEINFSVPEVHKNSFGYSNSYSSQETYSFFHPPIYIS